MIELKKLSNGIRVVHELIPHYRSCTIGIWVRAGSVTETNDENGISHLIEHMMFKGTKKRDARDIAIASDIIGGQMNAFTSKECTCYYIKVIDERLPEALDLLSDIFFDSVFDPDELEKEKKVVLEEIAMYNDTPDDVVQEKVASSFFSGTKLEKTILGPEGNIKQFTQNNLFEYRNRLYNNNNIAITIVGNYDKTRLFDLLENYFTANVINSSGDSFALLSGYDPGTLTKKEITVHKDIEQAHICISFPGKSALDSNRYALLIANNILGGSMSSRLFQRIREKSGLAYSVYSYISSYYDAGMMSVYAGTMLSNKQSVLNMIREELEKASKDGFTKEEFIQNREQMKSNYLLSMENSSARMSSLGKSFITTGNIRSEDEVLGLIENVSYSEVNEVFRMCMDFNKCTCGVVGNI